MFLDCDRGCDFSYLRQEVVWVNYVRDRRDAQVHVLVTRARAGAGWEYSLDYFGLESYKGRDQMLSYSTSDTDTDDERRRGFARIFQLGLVAYAIGTPAGEGLWVEYREPDPRSLRNGRNGEDPWDYWVFRAGVNLNGSGEDRRDSQSYNGSFSARRTTEDWRIGVGVDQSYRESNFTFDDGERFKDVSRGFGLGGVAVKTLGDHWGVGVGASSRKSTFLNLDLSYRAAAAVEYNLFPYSQSSRHELTFSYYAGVGRLEYEEETVFGATEETRPDHGVLVSFDVERPWGESGFDLDLSSFLDDSDLYSARLSGNIDYRIVRGLSVRLFGRVSLVKDQIYLPLSGATDEEILLGRRALETDSRYSAGIGISYTFGSIFNNIVNSRLTGSSGGFHRIF